MAELSSRITHMITKVLLEDAQGNVVAEKDLNAVTLRNGDTLTFAASDFVIDVDTVPNLVIEEEPG